MIENLLQNSVFYVKNGEHGIWWPVAKAKGQIHAGWSIIPDELLLKPDYEAIKRLEIDDYLNRGKSKGAIADANALWHLLDAPSRHVWITFEDNCRWWCAVHDGAVINPRDEHTGNFWLVCDRKWSNESLAHKRLAIAVLPGTVTAAAGFRGTVCKPKAWETILRIIRDKQDDDASKAVNARDQLRSGDRKHVQPASLERFRIANGPCICANRMVTYFCFGWNPERH